MTPYSEPVFDKNIFIASEEAWEATNSSVLKFYSKSSVQRNTE